MAPYNFTGRRFNYQSVNGQMRPGRALSEEIIEELAKLRAKGLSAEKIAHKLGISLSSSLRYCRKIKNESNEGFKYKGSIDN